MDLRNWETFVGTGNAVVGATVEVRDASLTHPNPGSVLASTTTNGDGMWEFTGLSDGAKDVKITYLGKVKWHKGMTKHSVGLVVGENFTPADENLLRNGGQEFWRLLTLALLTTDTPISLGWLGKAGTGDTATVTRESTIVASGSQYSAKVAYVKSSGPCLIEQHLPNHMIYALRGRAISLSFQARQSAGNAVRAVINDGVETLGALSATTGSFITCSVTRTVSATATQLKVGAKIDASADVYIDNVILVLGSVPGVYTPRGFGQEVGEIDYTMLGRLFSRQFLLGAG